MSVSLTCKHCRIVISAESEDELVARVQEHVRTHERPQELTREHILSRMNRQRKS